MSNAWTDSFPTTLIAGRASLATLPNWSSITVERVVNNDVKTRRVIGAELLV